MTQSPANKTMADTAPSTPRRLTVKGERTRTAILDVAERQFSRRGYDGVSLRQIIDESAVGTAHVVGGGGSGHVGSIQSCPCPSTVFDGPPPRSGEELLRSIGSGHGSAGRTNTSGS